MEPPAYLDLFYFLIAAIAINWGLISGVLFLILLLFFSALVSGSEVAFFSLSPNDLHDLHQDSDVISERLIDLKERPRRLLATILIANNIINIAIVVLSAFLLNQVIPEESLYDISLSISERVPFEAESISNFLSFVITVAGVTFLLVLFGEVAPKIYASINNISFARLMTRPMSILSFLLAPLSGMMVSWSTSIERRFENNQSMSRQEIDKAIDLTVSREDDAESEVDILKGIVKFGDLLVKQIMKPRVDVVALDKDDDYGEVMRVINESGYSRIPVYNEDFDSIIGLLYIKDLLGHLTEDKNFEWQKMIRSSVLYVPEAKKIDELLKEFQIKKLHMAIVVDEFGGSSGIVTLEDIMEEVIGEIRGEFDEEEEVEYQKINDNTFVFEGKTMLNDVCRIVGEDNQVFDAVRGESDSLAGLVLENVGHIPRKGREFVLERFKLRIEAVTKKRIEKIKFIILERNED